MKATTMSLSLRISNKLSELTALEDFCDQCTDHWQLLPKKAIELNLVLDELCTNIISYAYNEPGEHFIDIQISLADNVLLIVVKDDGKPFDITAAEGVEYCLPLSEKEMGGLGIHFVRQYTRSICYKRLAGFNIITLEKDI